ncbi:rhodanese-like domain-containing protein [bacterium]|nr:MAG: rhodanese-like domain-containing protein [bacterium]
MIFKVDFSGPRKGALSLVATFLNAVTRVLFLIGVCIIVHLPAPSFAFPSDCRILPESLSRDTLLIDIRSSGDFSEGHIADALNIPLYSVKTKTFLKGKKFALIGEGYDFAQLMDLCSELRDLGYPGAGVLEGGAAAWYGKVVEEKGKPKGGGNGFFISSKDYFLNETQKGWLAVGVGVDANEAKCPLPDSIVADHGNPDALPDAISARADNGFVVITVFDSDGAYNAEKLSVVVNAVKKSGVRASVFAVEGGLKAIKSYNALRSVGGGESQQISIISSQNSGSPFIRSGCGSCQ